MRPASTSACVSQLFSRFTGGERLDFVRVHVLQVTLRKEKETRTFWAFSTIRTFISV